MLRIDSCPTLVLQTIKMKIRVDESLECSGVSMPGDPAIRYRPGEMNRSLKKALRRKCARWNDTGAELLVRPTVITDGRGAYRLRWDDNIAC